ncbi:helix-turn-helix domain-containing protein [Rhodospirillales bacterium]|nr:helix-turn-helix domain-containing protein [Rhodospirillales bacterium]
MADIKDRIKEIRKSLGLSLEEFAKELSKGGCGIVTEKAVGDWELGVRRPLPTKILALAELGQRHVRWVQTGVDPDEMRTKVTINGQKPGKIKTTDTINEQEPEAIRPTATIYRLEPRKMVVKVTSDAPGLDDD